MEALPGFIRNLIQTMFSNPDISIRDLNRKLSWLGWTDIELDARTLELILTDERLADLAAGRVRLVQLPIGPALRHRNRIQ
jgi:hypothetical protein